MTQAFSAAFIPRGSEYMDVIAFGVLIVFLVFKPSGILGEKMHERV
jgi:branched-chain amino acid transport system permease protein